jgi:carbamoyltransferase
MTTVLGINAYQSGASAALVADGSLLGAVEEERFTRRKYEVRFPVAAIRYCLDAAGLSIADIDHIAVAGKPLANLSRKVRFAVGTPAGRKMLKSRGDLVSMHRTRHVLARSLGVDRAKIRARVHMVEHHRAHIGSAFYVSPFDRAAVASLDGVGDMVSAMWGVGEGSRLAIQGEVNFPHSLGLFYLAFSQYLGFPKYGDEYKVMGLSAYGEMEFADRMREVVRFTEPMHYELDMSYFRHLQDIQPIHWKSGTPAQPPIWSPAVARTFGPARTGPDQPIEERHRNVAASVQGRLEEAVLQLLRELHDRTGLEALCLAGGVALNCVANGRIRDETGFKELFVQPAAYDGGTSLGAAYYTFHHLLREPRTFIMDHAYLGPAFPESESTSALEARGVRYERLSEAALTERTAQALADGQIVGWFQGRMEFGPRALGNRSILADPRRPEMKDILNSRIKHREPFRPFAPSIIEEATGDYFEDAYPSPFMLLAHPVKRERQGEIPAPTHVDGTGRLQTVRRTQNALFYDLIAAFRDRTGVPVLLNTSFNENEPICCTPREAVDTFCRTKMDVLVLGNLYAEKRSGP